MKSALIFVQIDFPFTHDLDRLRDLLPDGWQVKSTYPDLAELTQWAVEARYPSDMPDSDDDDAKRAAQQAKGIIGIIVSDLKTRSLAEI